jgi:hypothetical protein
MDDPATFDRDALHPGAAVAFEASATALLPLFEAMPKQEREEPFDTRLATETVQVIAWPPVSPLVDFVERVTGWSYRHGGAEFALRGEGYRALRTLVEQIRTKPPFRDGFSIHFLEEVVATWCAAWRKGEEPGPFGTMLLDRCSAAFRSQDYLLPLTHVEIERNFMIGRVEVCTIPTTLFTDAANAARERHPDNPAAGDNREKLGRELGNRVAVAVALKGEPRFTDQQAMDIADDIAGMLRFLSPSVVSSSVPSIVQPWGMNPVPQPLLLKTEAGRLTGLVRQWRHGGLALWKLSAREIARLTDTPLSNLAWFFDGRALDDYGEHVRSTFFAYCRALGRFEPVERLVGTITALERLLVRDQAEPLQHTVGERLAFLITKDPADRQRILKDYKAAYGLRSRAVHNLRGIDNEEAADRLFPHAFLAFYKAIMGLPLFATHKDFLDGIDQVKFGGIPRATGLEAAQIESQA